MAREKKPATERIFRNRRMRNTHTHTDHNKISSVFSFVEYGMQPWWIIQFALSTINTAEWALNRTILLGPTVGQMNAKNRKSRTSYGTRCVIVWWARAVVHCTHTRNGYSGVAIHVDAKCWTREANKEPRQGEAVFYANMRMGHKVRTYNIKHINYCNKLKRHSANSTYYERQWNCAVRQAFVSVCVGAFCSFLLRFIFLASFLCLRGSRHLSATRTI